MNQEATDKLVAEIYEKFIIGLPKQIGNYPVDTMLEAAIREAISLTPHWISVSEILPEDGIVVAILSDEHMFATRRLHPFDTVSARYIRQFQNLYTHWMPIPEPPRLSGEKA